LAQFSLASADTLVVRATKATAATRVRIFFIASELVRYGYSIRGLDAASQWGIQGSA
jgi:hypothetical protein